MLAGRSAGDGPARMQVVEQADVDDLDLGVVQHSLVAAMRMRDAVGGREGRRLGRIAAADRDQLRARRDALDAGSELAGDVAGAEDAPAQDPLRAHGGPARSGAVVEEWVLSAWARSVPLSAPDQRCTTEPSARRSTAKGASLVPESGQADGVLLKQHRDLGLVIGGILGQRRQVQHVAGWTMQQLLHAGVGAVAQQGPERGGSPAPRRPRQGTSRPGWSRSARTDA